MVGRRRSLRLQRCPVCRETCTCSWSAATASFTVNTQQGTLSGAALFVEHRELVFSVLGYGTSAGWRRDGASVRTALASFMEETDPAILSVQPRRLEMVSLSQPLPFAQFVDRYPSTVPAEEVALINQILPSESLSAERLAKRVVGGG